jgi:hypothetical protein
VGLGKKLLSIEQQNKRKEGLFPILLLSCGTYNTGLDECCVAWRGVAWRVIPFMSSFAAESFN